MVRKSNTKKSVRKASKVSEESLVFNCTSCSEPQLLVQGKRNVLCHPYLQVGVCRECIIFAHAAPVPVDDEGYEVYCRWCCELGNLIYCDKCKAPFCEECIVRNVGAEYYDSLSENEEWSCFICDPVPIMATRKLTKDVLNHQNFSEPSTNLIENCTAVYAGHPDVTDSEMEEIIKERLRLRRNNYNETLKSLAKSKSEKNEDESNDDDSDNKISDGDEGDEKSCSGESDRESESKARKDVDESDDAKDPSPDRLSDKESPCDSPKSKLSKSHSEKTKSASDKEVSPENSSEQSENEENKMDLAEGNKKAVNMKKEDRKSTSRATPSKKNNREDTTTSESEDQVAARKKPNSKPRKKRRRKVR